MTFYEALQIPPLVCDAALFDRTDMQEGTLDSDLHLNHANRHCKVGFAEQSHWFAGVLNNVGLQANKQNGWNLDISGHERIQLASYSVGHHFNWHIDTMVLSDLPLDRKITVVCLLNNPEEFEGGEFEMKFKSDPYRLDLRKGSIIAFPAFIPHRVTPVTQGIRHTATLWLTGPKFR